MIPAELEDFPEYIRNRLQYYASTENLVKRFLRVKFADGKLRLR